MGGELSAQCESVAAIILAAGKGTRMKSEQAKVLHCVLGQPLLFRVLRVLEGLESSLNVVVVGHQAEKVEQTCREAQIDKVAFALQSEQKGTGHAVQSAMPTLEGFDGRVLILNGDMPLMTPDILRGLLEQAQKEDAALTLLTAISAQHRDFGRIIRTDDGQVKRIQEAKDCSPEEYAVQEVNVGAYCAKADFLRKFLPKLTSSNAQGELYLTDLVSLGYEAGEKVTAVITQDISCALGVNSRADLARASAILKERKLHELMLSGVSVIDPASTWIEEGVQVGSDSEIWPGTVLQGTTQIGRDCVIGPNTQITDSIIGQNARVVHSVLNEATVGNGVNIGPFAYLRPKANISDNVKIGDFVEIKNSNIGLGTKVPHLTYVGDSDIGSKTNLGCGTITCNYDGQAKHRTVIGDNVFIGSNSSLVAPVKIGDGAKTGAGAVIIRDVAPGTVVVGVPAHDIVAK